MKKDEFVKVINALIDARVKKIFPELLKKEMDVVKSQLKKEMSEGTLGLPDEISFPNLDEILKEDVVRQRTANAPKAAPKTYTKDAKLNAILQQTAEEIKSGDTDANYINQYKQLLAEQYQSSGEMDTMTFNTSNMSSIVNKTPPSVPPEIEQKIALEVGKKQIEAATGNAELGGIIMKDYRSFLKKVDEKSKANPNRQLQV